ncbi:hypothetical protein GGX14DRAFT_637652 [Mycena pura]|uniref:Uncharacterized protein n=1 Tax=Mycena pura TaxID=153505 RepID=A0AAD6V994_9AGAR|nr:hypothetical protein GGX14DRAFT_637652 [Mycena pura]
MTLFCSLRGRSGRVHSRWRAAGGGGSWATLARAQARETRRRQKRAAVCELREAGGQRWRRRVCCVPRPLGGGCNAAAVKADWRSAHRGAGLARRGCDKRVQQAAGGGRLRRTLAADTCGGHLRRTLAAVSGKRRGAFLAQRAGAARGGKRASRNQGRRAAGGGWRAAAGIATCGGHCDMRRAAGARVLLNADVRSGQRAASSVRERRAWAAGMRRTASRGKWWKLGAGRRDGWRRLGRAGAACTASLGACGVRRPAGCVGRAAGHEGPGGEGRADDKKSPGVNRFRGVMNSIVTKKTSNNPSRCPDVDGGDNNRFNSGGRCEVWHARFVQVSGCAVVRNVNSRGDDKINAAGDIPGIARGCYQGIRSIARRKYLLLNKNWVKS